jgi:hypothetical protein
MIVFGNALTVLCLEKESRWGKLDIVAARKNVWRCAKTYKQMASHYHATDCGYCGPITVCPAETILSGGKDMGCCMKRQVLGPPY